MTSSTETDTPKCPDCNAPMRLTRVLPTVLPKACGTETHVFACTSCGVTVTRTVHGQQA
jgi:primosomal protein N'